MTNPINTTATSPDYIDPRPGFGFIPFAELWNGRLAMLGFISALVTEYVTGQGTLHFLGLM